MNISLNMADSLTLPTQSTGEDGNEYYSDSSSGDEDDSESEGGGEDNINNKEKEEGAEIHDDSSSEGNSQNAENIGSSQLGTKERVQTLLATTGKAEIQDVGDNSKREQSSCTEEEAQRGQKRPRRACRKNNSMRVDPDSDDEPLEKVSYSKSGGGKSSDKSSSWNPNKSGTNAGGVQAPQDKTKKEKPFKCDLCDVACTQRNGLLRHRRIHTGEKPYKCDACAAEFTTSSGLKQHKLKHTGEKPFKCGLCGQKFAWKGNFDRHVRQHSANQPYKCATCGVAFESAPGLKRHERTHLGPMPYKCNICSKPFAKVNDYYYHRKKDHKVL